MATSTLPYNTLSSRGLAASADGAPWIALAAASIGSRRPSQLSARPNGQQKMKQASDGWRPTSGEQRARSPASRYGVGLHSKIAAANGRKYADCEPGAIFTATLLRSMHEYSVLLVPP